MSLCNQIGERSDIVEKLNSRRIACSKKVGIFPVYLKPIPGLFRHDDRLRSLNDRLRDKKLRTSVDKALFTRKQAGFQPYY